MTWLLFALALLLRLAYTFAAPVYRHLLYSDCLGYYDRAEAFSRGHVHDPAQWALWPPAGHMVYGCVLWLWHDLRLPASADLPCLLAVNCVLSALGCAGLCSLVRSLFPKTPVAGVCAGALAAGCWPSVYWCQYVLSENLAVPLLVCGLALAVSRAPARQCGGGFLLALAVAVRPQCGLMLAPLAVYLVGGGRLPLAPVVALAFLGNLALVLAPLSGGVSLAPNGGVNFAITQGRLQGLYTGEGYLVSAPQFNGGPYSTRRFWHASAPAADQAAYYRLGLRFLPQALPQDFANVVHLWAGPRFPNAPTPGFHALEVPTQCVCGGGEVLCLLLVPCAWRRVPPGARFLWAILLVPVLLAPAFGAERRFGYAVLFAAQGLAGYALALAWQRLTVVSTAWLAQRPALARRIFLLTQGATS